MKIKSEECSFTPLENFLKKTFKEKIIIALILPVLGNGF